MSPASWPASAVAAAQARRAAPNPATDGAPPTHAPGSPVPGVQGYWPGPYYALRTLAYKYIEWREGYELYNLRADPWELNNIFDTAPRVGGCRVGRSAVRRAPRADARFCSLLLVVWLLAEVAVSVGWDQQWHRTHPLCIASFTRAWCKHEGPLPTGLQPLLVQLQSTLQQLKTCRGASCRFRQTNNAFTRSIRQA